jgi:hypothetical protein
MDEMTDKVTFQESSMTDDKRPRSLRARLGPLGFTIALVTVVLAFLALGAAVSMLIRATRRPPIVAPTHGAVSQAVVASVSSAYTRRSEGDTPCRRSAMSEWRNSKPPSIDAAKAT